MGTLAERLAPYIECEDHGRDCVPNTERILAEIRVDSIDAAWAEAEAAARESGLTGYEVVQLWRRFDGWLAFVAGTGRHQPRRPIDNGDAQPTPAAALRALAVKLREREG